MTNIMALAEIAVRYFCCFIHPSCFLNRDDHVAYQMPSRMVREVCRLDQASTTLLKTAMKKLQLSARAYDRILKVSRTIADLNSSTAIKVEHLAESIQFRSLDRENWSGE